MKTVNAIKITHYALGLSSMVLALLLIYHYRSDVYVLTASGYLFLICATDTLYSKIPNIFTFTFIIIGVTTNVIISGLPGFMGSIAGFTIGLLLLLIPFLMGGMGAGDVKALAALGALLGPGNTFQIFLYMGLIGGIIGLFFHLMSPNARKELYNYASMLKNFSLTRDYNSLKMHKKRFTYRFPYATAIAFGFYAVTFWGDII